MQSYTAAELERETGFDRRTIAYYVQIRLLPKVGRRGSRTRYPKLFRDRLLFIRQVREAEQTGAVQPVSLRDMRKIFEHARSELISQVADGRTPVTSKLVTVTSTGLRSLARRRAAIADRWAYRLEDAAEPELPEMSEEPTLSAPHQVDDELPEAHGSRGRLPSSEPAAELKRQTMVGHSPPVYYKGAVAWNSQLSEESELGESLAALQEIAGRHRYPSPAMDQWLRIEVSPDITLAVRGVTDEAAPLLERVARCLRRLMRRRSQSEPDEEEDRS